MRDDTSAGAPVVGPVDAPDLHCMSLNVRRARPHLRADHQDSWSRRRPAVTTLVTSERPHLIAVQEALPAQADHLTADLASRWEPVLVGRGRHGAGERVGLFIDTERLHVAVRRSWALSRTPDRPGSMSWGTAFPRIAVGAVLDDRVTGTRFLALAVHLDHVSAIARRRSAALVGRIATASGLPTVAMGDWNAPADSAPSRRLADAGFADTWHRASSPVTTAIGTRHGYRTPRPGGRRIDRILTLDGAGRTALVARAAISVRRPAGVWPSDHAAVHAVIRWEAT